MAVTCELDDAGILTVTLDDGDKNTFTPEVFAELTSALDDHPDASTILLLGRDGILSAGLDLRWMAERGPDGVADLLTAFGSCLMRWWTDPRPTVCAATGHAIAAGTMLAMACDHAVATEGGFWGLTETQVGLPMPRFGLALAAANLPADRLEDLILPGERIDAAEAVAAGFADVLVADQLTAVSRARDRAEVLAALPAAAYASTKERLRGAAAAEVLDGLAADIAELTAGLR